ENDPVHGLGIMLMYKPVNERGPAFNNITRFLARVKQSLDPYNIANPGRLIDMEKVDFIAQKVKDIYDLGVEIGAKIFIGKR
ncbi:MAG: hypothetical protein ACFFBS_10340, partial [Promethearchaeota archaeon]